MKKSFCLTLLAGLVLCWCERVNADVYVVASAASSWNSMTPKELLALYMGRSRSLDMGVVVNVLDLPREHPARDEFYAALTGMTAAQVNSYWSRLIFTGKTMPPPTVSSEQFMLESVQRNTKAIGYLSKPPNDPAVKTLLVIKGP
jgi:hypothetical protein